SPVLFFSYRTPPTSAIYTLSLHDALPIFTCSNRLPFKVKCIPTLARLFPALANLTVSYDAQMYQPLPQLLSAFTSTLTTLKLYRSEEHTSELQSRFDLVCRLLLEKKNKT